MSRSSSVLCPLFLSWYFPAASKVVVNDTRHSPFSRRHHENLVISRRWLDILMVLPLSRWCDTPKKSKSPPPETATRQRQKKYRHRRHIASRWSPCWSLTAAGGIIRKSIVLCFFWYPSFVFCPYDRCERKYSHFPIVKLGGNWVCQWG